MYVEPCYYCGIPATSLDHVIPVSMLAALEALGDDDAMAAIMGRFRYRVLPACRECNSVLGNKYFDTVGKRREYVKESMRRRYKSVLEMPDWSDSDLATLSPTLQQYVLQALAERTYVRKRIAWRQGQRPEYEEEHRNRFGISHWRERDRLRRSY